MQVCMRMQRIHIQKGFHSFSVQASIVFTMPYGTGMKACPSLMKKGAEFVLENYLVMDQNASHCGNFEMT